MLSLLEPADGSGGPALLPEDRLRVTLFERADQTADPWATLDFDVVDTPNLPGNSALYQKLHLKPETDPPTLSAPLCPGRSTPTHVEAVDPAEMVSGVLRRRAMFYWYDFTPAPGGQFEGTYAVLKRNLAGAAWLPDDLVTEWQKPDSAPSLNRPHDLRPPQQHTPEMPGVENPGRGLQGKDDGGTGPVPLPSTAIGVAVQVSLTIRTS